MIVLNGDSLRKYIEQSGIASYKKRYCFSDCFNYLNSNDKNVLCLYGLRRTGKTTLIDQSIAELNDYSDCLRIICDINDDMFDIIECIKNNDKKYIFIDEVTKVNNFINTSSVLYDLFTYSGKKIILAGTDSLGFYLASNNELYDRCKLVHTTYIPYKEWNYIFDKSFNEYLNYGGTMTDGSLFYNEDGGYLSKSYINSAIVDNVSNSILKWNNKRNYLVSRYSIEEISSALRKIIELSNRSFSYKTIINSFESHDLGSLNDLLIKHEITPLDKDKLEPYLKDRLHIMDDNIGLDKKSVQILTDYLIKMDILIKDNDDYIFTQPGLRHSQMEDTVSFLRPILARMNYTTKDQIIIINKLKQDIRGQMIEDILYVNLVKEKKLSNYEVTKYRDDSTEKEIDLILINKDTRDAIAIEVKNSSEKVKRQAAYLLDDNFCNQIQKDLNIEFIHKLIAYNGPIFNNNSYSVDYVNIEDILTDSWLDEKYAVKIFDEDLNPVIPDR